MAYKVVKVLREAVVQEHKAFKECKVHKVQLVHRVLLVFKAQ